MIGEQKRLPPSTECDSIQKSKHAHESNRQKALEFAKHIPKPKVVVKPLAEKPNEGRDFPRLRDSLDELGGTTHLLEEDSDGFDDTYYVQSNNVYDDNFETAAKISALEAKRMDARKQVEAIKKSLGLAK